MVKENGMVMLTQAELDRIEREHSEKIEEYEKRVSFMQSAIKELMKDGALKHDLRVAKIDFLAIYNKALNEMFDNFEKECEDGTELPNEIYGHDVTVHWHGLYCNCGNGATPTNTIIDAVESCDSEDPSEYDDEDITH